MSDKNIKAMMLGWRQVKFGDVVRQCKEKTDPETSGLERYIAGDHMDTDNLRLRRWGEIGSGYLGPAFHIRFKPGQILYGSRRTYLRKVAVADFEGICANTTFVLEPKNLAELLPEFLPFLMQTDAFNNFSVKNSKGSVNPYINFSDLAKFEFALPTIEQQREYVTLLADIENGLFAQSQLIESMISLRDSYRKELFTGGDGRNWAFKTLAEVAEEKYGIVDGPFGSNLKTEHYRATGIPVIQSGFVTTERFQATTYVYVDSEKFEEQKRSAVRGGDIVMAKIGENCGACAVVPDTHPVGLLAGNALKITPNKALCTTEWVRHALQALRRTGGLRTVIKTTAQPAMSLAELRKLKIPVPSLSIQESLTSELAQMETCMSNVEVRHAQLFGLKKTVLAMLEDKK